MNARAWLEEVTKGMPEAVRDRVQAETLAHLEDAGVGEGADVRAVLGEPKAMRRELGRLYVPAKRLRHLEQESASLTVLFVGLLALRTLVGVPLLIEDPVRNWSECIPYALALFASSLVFAATRDLHKARRQLWRSQLLLGFWLIAYSLSPLSPLVVWKEADFSRLGLIAGLYGLAHGFVIMPLLLRHEDRRLRRTLALVGGAQL